MYKNYTRSTLWIACIIILCGGIDVDAFLGIIWGRMATQRFVPSMVVDLLLQNGIPELRIYQPTYSVLDAFCDTDIGVTITVQNNFLKNVKVQKDMDDFLYDRVKIYANKGLKFRYVYIGTDPFNSKFNGSIVRVLNMARRSLDSFNLHDVKVTTPHPTNVLINVTKPSESDFLPEIKEEMIEFLSFIKKTGGPFVFDTFPLQSLYNMGFDDVEFVFFDNDSSLRIVDGERTYYNLFTLMYDSLVVALTKAGFGDLEIVFGQIGWPTDGYMNANPENAERFYRGLLKHLGRKKGTPLRPNKDISVFLNSLSDENIVNYVAQKSGSFQRHWGIYKHNGEPKYNIDFTMRGRDDYKPAVAKGTVKMPYRWCVFDGKTDHDIGLVKKDFDFACDERSLSGDCSSFGSGGSCDNLTFAEKVSYAYNMRYQMLSQKDCSLTGAILTTHNPSTPDCDFPIEILTADVDGAAVQRQTSFATSLTLVYHCYFVFLLSCITYFRVSM